MSASEPQPLRGLTTVRVNRPDLLEKVRTNREEHIRIYKEALDGYHAAIVKGLERRIEETNQAHRRKLKETREFQRKQMQGLEKQLEDARSGKAYNLPEGLHLIEPTDHSPEYDLIIAALDSSLDAELELPIDDFGRYALDRWPWQGNWLTSAGPYSDAAAEKLARLSSLESS